MVGIRTYTIVDADIKQWGIPYTRDDTRRFINSHLSYPLKLGRHLSGKLKEKLGKVADHAPDVRYLVPGSGLKRDKKFEPALPLIRAAIERLLATGEVDLEQVDALIVAGAPYCRGEPQARVEIIEELDSHGVIKEGTILGKKPGRKPWLIETISNYGCVNWFNALRRIKDLVQVEKIRTAILVSFGVSSAYFDPRKVYEAGNFSDDGGAAKVTCVSDEESQICFGESHIIPHKDENGNFKIDSVLHDYNPTPLTFWEKLSFRTGFDDLEESLNASVFISNQIAKDLLKLSKESGVSLTDFDAIIIPQVNESFLDGVEFHLGEEHRETLGLKFRIRPELKQIMANYLKLFGRSDKIKNSLSWNFLNIIKLNQILSDKTGFYSEIYDQLTEQECSLFNYMERIHQLIYRTYNEAGYSASNSIPGGLALAVSRGVINLNNSKIAIVGGALGYSFDSLTLNMKPVINSASRDTQLPKDTQLGTDGIQLMASDKQSTMIGF